ncbi:hypothetical protein PEC18_03720 [Paucibacter sp. O1-1]|nr:hypothetical protein [Paucibacter sp. O1-1]MDA3824983.1 hypothetical protein [Paucibacter sp. O1-1]
MGKRGSNLVQQFRAFVGQRTSPLGKCLVEIVLRSRPTDVESEVSEFLDFGGREPE